MKPAFHAYDLIIILLEKIQADATSIFLININDFIIPSFLFYHIRKVSDGVINHC